MSAYVRCERCNKDFTRQEWLKQPTARGDGGRLHVPAGDDPVLEPAYTLTMRNCGCESSFSTNEGDWIVLKVERSERSFFLVSGINHSDGGRAFIWDVRSLNSPRYVLDDAEWSPDALAYARSLAAINAEQL